MAPQEKMLHHSLLEIFVCYLAVLAFITSSGTNERVPRYHCSWFTFLRLAWFTYMYISTYRQYLDFLFLRTWFEIYFLIFSLSPYSFLQLRERRRKGLNTIFEVDVHLRLFPWVIEEKHIFLWSWEMLLFAIITLHSIFNSSLKIGSQFRRQMGFFSSSLEGMFSVFKLYVFKKN